MIRTGSIDGLMVACGGDLAVLEMALEDYERGTRREHCSRKDFVAGWLAAFRRLRESGPEEIAGNLTVAA